MPMTMNADQILKIPEDAPERLFSAPDKIDLEYRDLIKYWHPDHNHSTNASKIAAHINVLYHKGRQKADVGSWLMKGVLDLKYKGGIKRLRYLKHHVFELGEMVYGHEIIAYIIRPEFSDLYDSARKRMDKLKYPNATMQTELTKCMPAASACFDTIDGRRVMVMEKTPDVFLLRDVMNAMGGKLPPAHAGWLLNRAYNLACCLNYNAIAHCDISPDTLFVSPQHHSALLLGGWWYATKLGKKMTALPDRSMHYAPPDLLRAKLADSRLDTTLIKVLGRELLGDATGMRLPADKSIPAPIVSFLRAPAHESAVEEYRSWKESVLPASFGKPRFVKMEIDATAVYQGA